MVRHLGTGTEPEKPYHMLRPARKYPLEEALNNQVDEMTLPVGISSCWCPPQGWYNGHTNIVAVVAKMEAMHGPPQKYRLPLTKANLDTAESERPTCQQYIPMLRHW